MNFDVLKGKTITEIRGGQGDEEMDFICSDDTSYRLFHDQDCCERVDLEDIVGDLKDLLETPILLAEEVSSPEGFDESKSLYDERPEWTFYKLSTINGSVLLRWYGESDYYSTSMSFKEIS